MAKQLVVWCSFLVGVGGQLLLVLGPPLELYWGDSSLAGMFRVAPVLLQCVRGYSLVLA